MRAATVLALTSLPGGCYQSPAPLPPPPPPVIDECMAENGTTMLLNNDVSDVVAPLELLEAEDPSAIISPALLDLVNASHALSTGGMPDHALVTQIPEYCFDEQETICGCDVWMYAITSGEGRGIYVPSKLSLKDKVGLDHELGHLQPGGGDGGREVMATLNSVEQFLTTFVVLAKNYRDNPADLRRFFRSHYANPYSQEWWALSHIYAIDDGTFDERVEEIHEEAYPYLFLALTEKSGSFSRVRRDVQELVADGRLEDSVRERLPDFKEMFALETYDPLYTGERQEQHFYAREAEAILRLKRAFITYLTEHFGESIARAYASESAKVSISQGSPMLLPFGERDCEMMNYPTLSLSELVDCTAEDSHCARYGAAAYYPSSASFCCVEPTFEGRRPRFSKLLIEGDVRHYIGPYTIEEHADGSISFHSEPLEIDGRLFSSAIPSVTIRGQSEIDIDERCR